MAGICWVRGLTRLTGGQIVTQGRRWWSLTGKRNCAVEECEGLVFTGACRYWLDLLMSGSLCNLTHTHKKKHIQYPRHGWTQSLVSIVTRLSISLNIAGTFCSDHQAQLERTQTRGQWCSWLEAMKWSATVRAATSQCIYIPNCGLRSKRAQWDGTFYFTREFSSIHQKKKEDVQGATCWEHQWGHLVLSSQPLHSSHLLLFYQVCKTFKKPRLSEQPAPLQPGGEERGSS